MDFSNIEKVREHWFASIENTWRRERDNNDHKYAARHKELREARTMGQLEKVIEKISKDKI